MNKSPPSDLALLDKLEHLPIECTNMRNIGEKQYSLLMKLGKRGRFMDEFTEYKFRFEIEEVVLTLSIRIIINSNYFD